MNLNVYFLTDYENTYYLHKLAGILKKEGIANKLGIQISGQKYHQDIKNQNETNYDYIHLVQNVAKGFRSNRINKDKIEEYEEKFGEPFLQQYVLGDRHCINFTYKNQLRFLQRWFSFYDKFFSEFNPDLVITDGLAAAPSLIPFRLVQDYGGHGLWWRTTRIKDRQAFHIDSAYEDFYEVRGLYERLKTGEVDASSFPKARQNAKDYLHEFRETGETQAQLQRYDINTFKRKVQKLTLAAPRYIRYWYLYNISRTSTIKKDDYTRPTTTERVRNDLEQVYRKYCIKYSDVFEKPNNDENFVYFPLHLQPEYSTMYLAPMYLNQIEAIRKISRSIPVNHKLYVKEHPSMIKKRGWREMDYYKELKSLSNVELINPFANSHSLIKESELVTTITGTAGFEAVMYKKPAIVFGKPHYRVIPFIYNYDSPENLSQLIQIALSDHEHNDEVLLKYLTALFEKSFEMPSNAAQSPKEKAEERADAVFPHLVQQVNKIYSQQHPQGLI